MDKLWGLFVLNLWLAVMVYSWLKNRNGELDKQNYRFWQGILEGQSEEGFLRQRRILHRLGLPFVVGFYVFGTLGVLGLI